MDDNLKKQFRDLTHQFNDLTQQFDNLDRKFEHSKNTIKKEIVKDLNEMIETAEANMDHMIENRSHTFKDRHITMLIKTFKFFIFFTSISILISAIASLLQPFFYGALIKFCGPGIANQVKEIILAIKSNV